MAAGQGDLRRGAGVSARVDAPAFLRDECGDDAALREEVESLLAAHAEAGSFAELPPIDAMGAR